MGSRTEGVYGEPLASAFGLSRAPTVISRALHKSTLAVTELRGDLPNFGLTASLPREDAYLVALQLRACHDHDLYFDGRLVRPTNWRAGVTSIYDLRQDPVADIRDPFHCLMFYLPRVALNAVAAEAGAPPLDELRYQRAVGIDDTVARQLLSSVRPAIAQPEHAHPLFLDHVVMAMASHIAYAYGGVRARQMHHRGGLAAWQLRRATQLMSESLTEGPGLRRLVRRSESLYARIQSRGWRESGPVAPRLVSRRSTEAATRLALRVNPGDGIGRLGLAEQAGRRRTRHQRVTGERRTEVRSFTG